MSARLLVVDGVVTNRIVLKSRLEGARYEVAVAADADQARRILSERPVDLVLLDVSGRTAAPMGLCAAIKGGPSPIPVLALAGADDPAERLAALSAGADDVTARRVGDDLLLARIRALLRARAAEGELATPPAEDAADELSEGAAPFAGAADVVLVLPPGPAGLAARRALAPALPGPCRAVATDTALARLGGRRAPDVVVIDARSLAPQTIQDEIFPLMADLRSRPALRPARLVLLAPADAGAVAARALDLGADEVLPNEADAEELAFRTRRQVARKRRQEAWASALRDGILAAATDPLTGLHNRRHVLPRLHALLGAARRGGVALAVALLDLDRFKAVNDRFGHAAGDAVLIEMSRRFAAELRPDEVLARVGGEEFLLLMPGADPAQAEARLRAMRRAATAAPVRVPGAARALTVTFSAGIAAARPGDTAERLTARADAALYRAKRAGRDTVRLDQADPAA